MKKRKPLSEMSRSEKRTRAQSILHQALKRGLRKPDTCEWCSFKPANISKIHGHHGNYDRPMDVVWLCVKCHAKTRRGRNFINRSIAFLEHCEKIGIRPVQALRKRWRNPRNNRLSKVTIYRHWRAHEWPKINKELNR